MAHIVCGHHLLFTNLKPALLRWDGGTGEDMWHVYNLVRAGDKVTAVTFRKIAVYGAGGGESERVKIKLTIAVEAVDFDPEGQLSSKSRQQANANIGQVLGSGPASSWQLAACAFHYRTGQVQCQTTCRRGCCRGLTETPGKESDRDRACQARVISHAGAGASKGFHAGESGLGCHRCRAHTAGY